MKPIVIKKSEVDKQVKAISDGIEGIKNAKITPNDLRLAIMDYSDTNIPLYTQHLTDAMLWKCIEWAVNTFNEFPPHLSRDYTAADFPDKQLLLLLSVVEAFKLTALKELRGEMQYSDGGIQSTIYYKSPQFTALRQELQQQAMQMTSQIKKAENINNCYGYLC